MTGAGVGVVTFRCTRSDLHLEFHGATTDAFDYTRVGAHP